MPRIKATDLKVGMKVEADVRNADGMLLIPSGCELSERHLTILESWGIEEIQAGIPEGMDDPSDLLARFDPVELERLTAEVRARFSSLDAAYAPAAEVFQVMLRRHAKRHGSTAKSRAA